MSNENKNRIIFITGDGKESTVVMTGRNASQGLIDITDTVTEIGSIK